MRIAAVLLTTVCVGVGCVAQKPADTPTPAIPAPQVHANLLQVMRAIDFPNSNIIFDTQKTDPGAKPDAAKKEGGSDSSVTAAFAGLYGGWEKVENSALALAESANLILIPGRVCSNGKPVPVEREDFQKAAKTLADAGMAAYKAAQSKNLDAMVEVSGTVADACAICHETYRDAGPAGSPERCVPVAAAATQP